MIPAQVNFLYTNIGRGHPFYLDGIIEALVRRGDIGLVRGYGDVFAISRGLSRTAWRFAGKFYERGSSGKTLGAVYRILRSRADYNGRGAAMRLMGRDLRRRYHPDPSPLVVAHPILLGALRDRPDLIFQHGESAVPDEALVRGAATVIVPSKVQADSFVRFGYAPDAILVSGLCVEPALVRQAGDAYELRRRRFDSQSPLTGALFSSGAEPRRHVETLVRCAAAAVAAEGRTIVFAARHGRLADGLMRAFMAADLPLDVVDSAGPFPTELPPALLVSYSSRRELNHFTAQLFPHFDYFVAPPHERTNWALGLGLPMLLLGPDIGSYAPLNRSILLESGTAAELPADPSRGCDSHALRQLLTPGRLERMAESGWGRYSIEGFEKIAAWLIERYGEGAGRD